MRILFCNKYDFPFSGTEVYLLELMNLLKARGHDVRLFSMAPPSSSDGAGQNLAPWIDFKAAMTVPQRLRFAAHAIYSVEARRRLRRFMQQFRPDVAHVRNIYHHLSPSILWELRAQHVPVLYHINDFKMICPAYNLVCQGEICERCRGGRFWHVLVQNCYHGQRGSSIVLAAEAYVHKWLETYHKCVNRVLAPTAFAKAKLIENGWRADRISVLYHFQQLHEYRPVLANAPILYFGRLSAEKGLIDLLHAIQRLPKIALRIAGEGPQRPHLESLATELELKNVRFVGGLDSKRLSREIEGSAFTVFPSRAYETLGKSILESYAHGRAVIASDLGSRREMVVNGETGLLYEAGNADQLADAISRLHDDPSLCRKLGEAGRRLVSERHSPEKHLEALEQIYEDLAREPKRALFLPGPAIRRRLRIGFIGGRGLISKYSGIESYYEEVGKRLVDAGHEVTVYCRNYFTPDLPSFNGMQIVRLGTLRMKHLDTLVHTLLSTVHAMLSDCEIVHYHALGPALFCFLPRLVGKKTVVTVQGLDWQRKKWGHLASAVLHIGEYAATSFPNSTMVVSRTLQDYFRFKHNAETVYIPNGTCLRQHQSGCQLESWGLEPDNYILFLGRFSPEKNCDLLIQAYERLNTSAKLVLAGGSSYSDPYMRKLRTHNSDCILVLDWVSGEALEELLTNAMLFVLPSDLEGLSLALLDAMGAGLCVVVSDVPENRELMEGAGFTFPKRDVAALTELLHRLIADPDARKRAGRAAQERVRQHYLWLEITRQIEREYFNVMDGAPRQQSKQALSKAA
ncbi:MAG TPA: glycosyltransferase family 4 protein [Terriglobales bacterium]|nr:glycosyltransferase family 4 protein [Terriglobales bacterium]